MRCPGFSKNEPLKALYLKFWVISNTLTALKSHKKTATPQNVAVLFFTPNNKLFRLMAIDQPLQRPRIQNTHMALFHFHNTFINEFRKRAADRF